VAHSPVPEPNSPEILTGRRKFFQNLLRWGTVAVGGLATVALGIPFVGYLLGALYKREKIWVPLGPASGYPIGETRTKTFDNPLRQPWDGMVAHTGVFVRNLGPDEREKNRFLVFAVNCAHLGCPVSWFPQSGLFMCPCHGGVYYENGDRASGPPPRGLFPCEWHVTDDGILEVQAPHLPTLQDTLTDKKA
jgi:Rieske Fe-S protein